MDFLNENSNIGNLVAKAPEYAKIFEKLGLDYCCKGNRTLKESCDEKKLQVVEVLETLRQLSISDVPMNWDQMTIREIVEHIVDTYHIYSKQELPRISQLIEKINTKHGQRYPYISDLQNIFEQMKKSLLEHMEEEEMVVFPLLINLERHKESYKEEVKKHLGSLDNDHLETGDALDRIKKLTNDYAPPLNACTTHIVMLNSLERLERNLHEHIHKENQILFPRAMSMI